MATEKIKLDKVLLDKVRKFAALSGYSSVEEFITHLLEKELARIEDSDSEDEIRKKLKGLGYIG
jgi:metal-responsive CopG/Arc/MetJ family transcriptional regulator